MGMGDTLIRGRLQYKYHYCARCGVRYPLSQMVWQSGILLCLAQCHDTITEAQRDSELARKEAIAGQSRELQPDVKITDGAVLEVDDLTFIP